MDIPPTAPKLNLHRPKQAPRPDRSHYGYRHQQLRKLKLEQTPLCEYQFPDICTGWATECDHLQYPATRLEHYASACANCHRLITLQRRKQAE